MEKVYFGKFDKNKPEQIAHQFYAAGSEGDKWYGGIQPGNYVFPISNSRVLGLWRVSRYGERPNQINQNNSGVVFFDELVKFQKEITVQQFIKSPYFDLNVPLLNQVAKASQQGFFEIPPTSLFPWNRLENIEFNLERNIYVVLKNNQRSMAKPHDLFVVVSDLQSAAIERFEEFNGTDFEDYKALRNLYEKRNKPDERYTLRKLHDFAVKDESPRKENYITSVLKELQNRGHFVANNPIQLYDNILVGRRRTPKQVSGAIPTRLQDVEEIIDINLDVDDESLENYKRYADLLQFNPNLILYGPPGTGKTFATKKIIEAFESGKKQYISFDQVEKEGRVRFITFHQSYSYEEFIEGIRPELNDDEDREIDGTLSYQLKDGILKELVQSASTQVLKAEQPFGAVQFIQPTSRVWKVSLGRRHEGDIYDRCMEQGFIAGGWHKSDLSNKSYEEIYQFLLKNSDGDIKPKQDASSLNSFVSEMSKGDIVLVFDSETTIRDIGVITGDYEYKSAERYAHTRAVQWLKHFETPKDILQVNGGVRLTLKTIYQLWRVNLSDVQEMLDTNDADKAQTPLISEPKPFYLIIDEINRGNISKIFGELITLIEKDKRGTTKVTLPYSHKKFSIPRNLFLIGTMNTADRSIAMLDTALRRRFAFVEIEPDYEVFTKLHSKVNNIVELSRLLRALNDKIAELLDRDHRIGHAYLMEIITLDDLYNAWYFKILPLLTEYFYNDIATIQSIVGKGFFAEGGSFNYLNVNPVGEHASEFEHALMKIYAEKIE